METNIETPKPSKPNLLTTWLARLQARAQQLIAFAKQHKKLAIIALVIIVIVGGLLARRAINKWQEARNMARWAAANQQPMQQQEVHNAQPVPVQRPQTKDFRFQRFPFDLKDIGSIAPIGEFGGITRQSAAMSHFYGNYRNYVFSKHPGEYAYNVYAPADGEIISFRNSNVTDQFRFTFRISDKAFYYLDHIQSLSPQMLEALKPEFGSPLRYTNAVEQLKTPIKVKAGDVLGQTGLKGIAWDWGAIDGEYCQDIIHPEHYAQDQCPRSVYDFLTDDMKTQIAPLAGYWASPPNGRGLQAVTTTPPLGQYAHDKAGTLSGGWIQVERSWQNAFFVPDAYLPNALTIRLAIPELSVFGVWNGLPVGTTRNPDPLKVTPASGIVGYVLERQKARDTTEYGVLLVRVNNDETITLETIANATAVPANPHFTNKAITIKR